MERRQFIKNISLFSIFAPTLIKPIWKITKPTFPFLLPHYDFVIHYPNPRPSNDHFFEILDRIKQTKQAKEERGKAIIMAARQNGKTFLKQQFLNHYASTF